MKRFFLITLLLSCLYNSYAQTLVVELFYNVNGNQFSALCVFDGNYGKCNVISTAGNCWYDAYYSQNGSYSSITTSNPSVNGWIPGVCYFTPNGNYVVFQGYKFGLYCNVIPQRDWNIKKAQYGFPLDGTSFKDKPVEVRNAQCNHSGCRCSAYRGYLTPAGIYKGNCSNSDGWGHTCNHSPKEHGLN